MTLELTETGAMREALQMMDVLTRLRLKGFKLSIDIWNRVFLTGPTAKHPFSRGQDRPVLRHADHGQ